MSRELGINPKMVAKWRKRQTLEDRKTGPKEPRSTTQSEAEEATVVAFRRHTLLPLDDCLYALQSTIPQLTEDIVELARRYGRHGYRRIAALLRSRAGWVVNDKRVERIWRREVCTPRKTALHLQRGPVAGSPQQAELERFAGAGVGGFTVRADHVGIQAALVRSGAAIAMLRDFMIGDDGSLVPARPNDLPLRREVWLVFHMDMKVSAPVRAVVDWLRSGEGKAR